MEFNNVLVVDDDDVCLRAYTRGFGRTRSVRTARALNEARAALAVDDRVDLVILDLRLGPEWGLDLVADLNRPRQGPSPIVIVVSGYLSVAYAVMALEMDASTVLFKPVSCAELLSIANRIRRGQAPRTQPSTVHMSETVPSLERVEWEHITRVMVACGGNVSAAARCLRIHRQSLQRKLRKHAPQV